MYNTSIGICVRERVFVLYGTPWRDKGWFTEQFIYIGKSIRELSIELGMDWSSLERWRQIHGLPRHSERERIIAEYGLDVFENIVKRKKERYSISNKRKAEIMYKGKSYEDIYGKEKAQEIKNKISASNKNVKRSEEFKENLSKKQRGKNNSNWKGGFYSSQVYKHIDRLSVKEYVLDTWNRYIVIEKDYTCECCGIRSITCNGHHLLSFTKIFDAICFYLDKRNCLDTLSVISEMHKFHKENFSKIYKCLCSACHRNIHRQENYYMRIQEENRLIHLLEPYFSNPEPSLKEESAMYTAFFFKEGAETIEITLSRSE